MNGTTNASKIGRFGTKGVKHAKGFPPAPGREGAGSIKVTTQNVHLYRDVQGQNRTGLGKPNA